MTAKLHPPSDPTAQSNPATDWYSMHDLNFTTMTDNITLQKHDKSRITMESKLSSVEENQIAAKEQMTQLKDQMAQMRLEDTKTKKTVLDLIELVRTLLQKKTVKAEEGSILIPGSKVVNSSMDLVQHHAPEMLAKPHPEVPQSETPAQSTPGVKKLRESIWEQYRRLKKVSGSNTEGLGSPIIRIF